MLAPDIRMPPVSVLVGDRPGWRGIRRLEVAAAIREVRVRYALLVSPTRISRKIFRCFASRSGGCRVWLGGKRVLRA